MSDNHKDILQYIGDDGEFAAPVDELFGDEFVPTTGVDRSSPTPALTRHELGALNDNTIQQKEQPWPEPLHFGQSRGSSRSRTQINFDEPKIKRLIILSIGLLVVFFCSYVSLAMPSANELSVVGILFSLFLLFASITVASASVDSQMNQNRPRQSSQRLSIGKFDQKILGALDDDTRRINDNSRGRHG